MAAQILVAYTTLGGSTGEVAEAIGAAMRETGLQTEVTPMRSVQSIGVRTAVVLGAPLYMGGLPGDVGKFLGRNRVALAAANVWLYVLGPVDEKPSDFDAARAQAEKYLAKFGWFKPAELRIFGGKFDVNTMPFPYSLARFLPAFPAKNMPAKDVRDWDAIRAWALEVAQQVRPAA